MIKQQFKNTILYLSIVSMLICSCKDDSVSSNEGANKVYGSVTFIDGTPGAQARLSLKNQTTSRLFYDTTDANGNYNIPDVTNGNYVLRFGSSNYLINSFISDEFSLTGTDKQINFFITYSILDDQKVLRINDGIFFIQFNADAGKIGQNYDKVSKLIGYHTANSADSISLSCIVYEIPADFNWEAPGVEITPEYIAQNFTYLFETDESSNQFQLEIEFTGDMIPKILSNPANGFAFVKKSAESKRIEVPCVDRVNNDNGLLFEYQL